LSYNKERIPQTFSRLMIFNSLEFAVFFAAVLALYFSLRSTVMQNRLLFVASSIFYGWWDWRFLFLMYLTIMVDFFISKAISRNSIPKTRKRLLLTSITFNLSILGFFKYFNFFATSTTDLLNSFGLAADPVFIEIILPVGISFYTFQSMSYVIDVYKKRLKPAEHLLDYAAYVSLFPQLVAGPIERATHLLPQILKPRTVTLNSFSEGIYLIFWGLFKKLFIADNLAQLVDPVFSGSGNATGEAVLIATYAFAFQIYCDFSGYSDIARGAAKCMGFDLMLNFNLPYFSSNPSEFWRRWHISLSSWLRDYLYISLGGNKKGNYRTYINLSLTMLLGGLWHGASWNFVLWGAYQGALLVVHRACRPLLGKLTLSGWKAKLFKFLSIVVFFQFVCYGWLVFRAESATQIGNLSASLMQGINLSNVTHDIIKLMFYASPLILVQLFQYFSRDLNFVLRLPILIRTGLYVSIFYAIVLFGNFSSTEFIYFQF